MSRAGVLTRLVRVAMILMMEARNRGELLCFLLYSGRFLPQNVYTLDRSLGCLQNGEPSN